MEAPIMERARRSKRDKTPGSKLAQKETPDVAKPAASLKKPAASKVLATK